MLLCCYEFVVEKTKQRVTTDIQNAAVFVSIMKSERFVHN